MKSIIYVDLLLFLNIILTYLYLLTLCFICKIYVRSIYLLFGSLLGAVYSLVILIPPMHLLLQFLLKVAMCVSIVWVTFKPNCIKMLLKYSLFFLIINILFAGFVLMAQSIFGSGYILLQNGAYYMDIDIVSVLITTSALYLIIRIVILILDKQRLNAEVFITHIFFDGKYVELHSMNDTGNRLYEMTTGYPVLIVEFDSIKTLFHAEMREFLAGDFSAADKIHEKHLNRITVVNADFAAGEAVLPAFRPDHIVIYGLNRKHRIEHSVIAVTGKVLSEGSFQMLLHPDLLRN